MVDWLALTCQKYKLNANAQHLAVCLFDRFTDQFDLATDDVQILILCCLLIASKSNSAVLKLLPVVVALLAVYILGIYLLTKFISKLCSKQ